MPSTSSNPTNKRTEGLCTVLSLFKDVPTYTMIQLEARRLLGYRL